MRKINIRRQCLSPGHNLGSILIIALWVLVFFSILTVGLYKIISAQLSITKRLQQRVIAQYLAKAAVIFAQCERADDKTLYDTLYELGRERKRELGYGEFTFTLIDEESKININTISKKFLSRLPGLDEDLADAVMRSSLYPFDVKEELLLVEGINDETFEELKGFITICSDSSVNIHTASTEVFEALGMDNSLISIINNYLAGYDGQKGTDDDRFFESKDKILNRLREFTGLFARQQAMLIQLISNGLLTVSSQNFTIDINTKVLGISSGHYSVIIDEEKIRRWVEL